MVKNYFYLIVGVLCLLFAVTHTLNGISTSLQVLNNSVIENNTKVAFTYVWHIIGIENFVFGIALLIMAFQNKMSKVKFATWLIIMILAMRWIVITLFTLLNNSGNVMPLIPDTAAIFIVIVLLLLGTKVKDKIPNE
jgi:zinc transporter ZupT